MKVRIILEDTTRDTKLKGAFGLSMHIETGGTQLIFDVGPSIVAVENAEIMNINYEDIDYFVLSHGHVDHIGALADVIKKGIKGKIFASEHVFAPLYARTSSKKMKYIGIDPSLTQSNMELLNDQAIHITEDIVLLKPTVNDGFKPKGNQSLFQLHDGEYQLDDFNHELMLAVKEEDNLYLFTGCSHSGITNMIDSAMAVFKDANLSAVFGGFHTFNPLTGDSEDKKTLDSLLDTMRSYGNVKFYTGHCTGDFVFDYMNSRSKNIIRFYTGYSIEL